jgi:hypothetical protein
MELLIDVDGKVRMLYSDEGVPLLRAVGAVKIARVSFVEPIGDGRWMANMKTIDGPVLLGPDGSGFIFREEALRAERVWLCAHGLPFPGAPDA